MTQYKDPWADAANQAVGALYKYYMTRPNPDDIAAAQLDAQYKQAQTERLLIQNQTDGRAFSMGAFTTPNLSPEIRNDLYRRHVETSEGADSSAARLFGSYVNKPVQVDAGDTKYMVDGSTGMPLPGAAYGVGVAPQTVVDKEGGRLISTPAIPSTNRPAMQIADAMMPYLVRQESGGNPMALSPKGAGGLTQIMPDTARDPGYGVKPLQGWDGKDPRTAPVSEQLRFGRDYLGAMINERGNIAEGLAAYNAGPGAVQQYDGIPPYKETQGYVKNIMGNATGGQSTVNPDGTVITSLPESPVQTQKRQERERLRNIQGDLVNDELSRSLNLLNEKGGAVAGIVGDMTSGIPGLPSHDFSQMLDTIKANIGFDKLQSMREASPTGGALGQVSEFENRLLQAVFGSLAQSQSPQQLKYNMMRLQNTYNDIIYRGFNDDGSLRSQNNIGPVRHNIPSVDNISRMNSPEELQSVLEFFEYNPPMDIKNSVIQRANQLGF